MKKKTISAVLAVAAALGALTGCGSDAAQQAASEATATAQQAASDAAATAEQTANDAVAAAEQAATDAVADVVAEATGASADSYTIAIPNDTTNEARALQLLEALGYITLDPSAGIQATPRDITDNPYNFEFQEVEAAQVPNVLQDVDYAIINSNYALDAGLNPVQDSLGIEGSASAYVNIIAVYEGNETNDNIKALVAAVESQEVVDFIESEYDGSVVYVADVTDGYDESVDYDALAGTTISVAATPAPHAEILAIAKDILAQKDITLDIIEYNDYVIPNNVVEEGEVDANYFQHVPYLDDFNAENGTHLVSAAGIHVEPMGIYGGKQSALPSK